MISPNMNGDGTKRVKGYLTYLFAVFLVLLPLEGHSQSPLEDCADQFIGHTVSNAPTLFNSAPDEPFDTNRHLCYRAADTGYFAMEYWPEIFAPRWVAYKLSPKNYGEEGCSTYTRAKASCYFKSQTWEDFQACENTADPFHTDHMLEEGKLNDNDFTLTGHDRGHMAPAQAFSWNACGWYHTFSMANMSPQRGYLNQQIWANLEQQILTWAVDSGPVYVITGSLFTAFPSEQFEVYREEVLKADEIYPPDNTLIQITERHRQNYMSSSSGDILRPLRNADPDRINDRVKEMRVPTGYFKVLYIPESDQQPVRAIGFMIPHSFEHLNMLAGSYGGLARNKAFYAFVSRIDLIEETSGLKFSGIPQNMKNRWGHEWFFSNKTARNIRSRQCGEGSPQGVIENSMLSERIEACTELPGQ